MNICIFVYNTSNAVIIDISTMEYRTLHMIHQKYTKGNQYILEISKWCIKDMYGYIVW
jgi:hypothetical protein